jgi:acyl carrier protein
VLSDRRSVSLVEEEGLLSALAQATGLEARDLATTRSLLDLGLTSFRIMQALMQIEEGFGVEFSEEDIVKFPAVPASALVEFIAERIRISDS